MHEKWLQMEKENPWEKLETIISLHLKKIPGHISHRVLSFYMFKFYVLNFGGVLYRL